MLEVLALNSVGLAGVLGFTGVLGFAGELVGVETSPACLGGLPLRLAPAVNAESRYL